MASEELRTKRRRVQRLLRLRHALEREARQNVLVAGQQELEARRRVLEFIQAIAASAARSSEDALAGLQWIELLYTQLQIAQDQHAQAAQAYAAAIEAHREAWQMVRALEILEQQCGSAIEAWDRVQTEREVADWFLQRKMRNRSGLD